MDELVTCKLFHTSVPVIISKTCSSLWDNEIQEALYNLIFGHASEIRSKKQVRNLNRHHPVLLYAFRHLYGYNLQNCNYAGIKLIPEDFIRYYEIHRVPCYGNSYYLECINLHTALWLPCQLEKIQNDKCIHPNEKEHYRIESMSYAKKKTHVFL